MARYTHDQMDAVHKGQFYYELNKDLREMVRLAEADRVNRICAWAPYMTWFLHALSILPIEAGVVYRGLDVRPGEMSAIYFPGRHITFCGITSTSCDLCAAARVATPEGTVLRITAYSAVRIREFSFFGAMEDEWVLRPHTNFVVTSAVQSVISEGGGAYTHVQVQVIDLMEIRKNSLIS